MGAGKLRYASALTVLMVFALLLIAHAIYLYLADRQRFPINTVKIEASYQHITHKQLEKILENYLNSSFFTLPVSRLRADLLSLEWVNAAQVERLWPDILKIKVMERIPVAFWNNALITDEGKIFNKNEALTETNLPRLKGPLNQEQQVLQVYKKMSKILTIYGLHAVALEWRENEAWDLTLANGLQLRLGKRDLETRINRFCKAYSAVFAEKSDQVAIVDLRYPHGMAVQWKK